MVVDQRGIVTWKCSRKEMTHDESKQNLVEVETEKEVTLIISYHHYVTINTNK